VACSGDAAAAMQIPITSIHFLLFGSLFSFSLIIWFFGLNNEFCSRGGEC
jgi:hypothetical protein